MRGQLYIDEQDVCAGYGVFLAEECYTDLLAFAPLKGVESNNWQEEDGEELDLESPVLAAREVTLKFAFAGLQARLGAFIEMLSRKAYHRFEFREIGRTHELRLVSQPDLTLARRLGLFSLQFANDFPLKREIPEAPQSGVSPQGYDLDERSLAEYGVIVLEGCDAKIEQSPAVKKNLLQDIGSLDGAVYDGEVVTFETKDVCLNCLMRADTLSEFWRNYDALLFDLVQPGERSLYVDKTGVAYPCMYKSCSVSRFYPKGKIWFEFALTFTFTSFRVYAEEFLLAAENRLVTTEDSTNTIDLDYVD